MIKDNLGAQVYISLRDFERAVEDCDRAIAINPKWVKAYLRKAIAHSQQFLSIENILLIKETVETGLKLTNAETDAALVADFNDVLSFIKEEERIESNVPAGDFRREAIQKFEDWFKEKGGLAQNTKIRFVDPVERGLFATQEIKQGETVVFVPDSIVFTDEKGKLTKFGQQCAADNKVADGQVRDFDYVTFHFIEELQNYLTNKEASLFAPYFQVLPQSFGHLGSDFTDQEVELLKGTDFKDFKEDFRK